MAQATNQNCKNAIGTQSCFILFLYNQRKQKRNQNSGEKNPKLIMRTTLKKRRRKENCVSLSSFLLFPCSLVSNSHFVLMHRSLGKLAERASSAARAALSLPAPDDDDDDEPAPPDAAEEDELAALAEAAPLATGVPVSTRCSSEDIAERAPTPEAVTRASARSRLVSDFATVARLRRPSSPTRERGNERRRSLEATGAEDDERVEQSDRIPSSVTPPDDSSRSVSPGKFAAAIAASPASVTRQAPRSSWTSRGATRTGGGGGEHGSCCRS